MRKKDPQNERKNPRGAETSYMRLQKYGNTKLRDYETDSAIDCRNDWKYVNNGRLSTKATSLLISEATKTYKTMRIAESTRGNVF